MKRVRAHVLAGMLALFALLVGCGAPADGAVRARAEASMDSPAAEVDDHADDGPAEGEAERPDAQASGQADAKKSAKPTADAKPTAGEQPAETPSEPDEKEAKGAELKQMWKADFQSIAASSGMQVCVCAIDLQSNKKASLEGGRQMPSASMIKLLVAETFLRKVADGEQSLDDVYELRGSDIVGGTGVMGQMAPGTSLDMRTLLTYMIAESDNTATNVLIDRLGMDAINAEAEALGLKQTKLQRHMMDFAAAANGLENYTCANDVAKLLKMVYKKTFVDKQSSKLMRTALEQQTDNACIPGGLPDGVVFAHKTGAGSTVRHDGGIVEGDVPFVLVCLCGDSDGYDEYGAIVAMQQIGAAAYADAVAVYAE